MKEIKRLVSEIFNNDQTEVIGEQFSIISLISNRGGVQENGDSMKLYFRNSVIAEYSFDEQELKVLDWNYKNAIKYFVDCLVDNECAVYADEELLITD